MASLDQVIQQINFALNQLSTRNGHHEFEHICRHFSRLRISKLVIPATGPVADGGDQGRDFETFVSFLRNTLNSEDSRWAASEEEGKRIAFACTLQKKGVPTKIKSDLNSIGSSEPKAHAVYYFTASPIPVSKRHDLQAWAKATHGIRLDILDSEALSEQLSDRELFWIAERYLQIPGEIYPESTEEPGLYEERKSVWKESPEQFHINHAEFVEVRNLARHALYQEPNDVAFWLSVMTRFEQQFDNPPLVRKATYEHLAIHARHERSYEGIEEKVGAFLDSLADVEYVNDAEDLLNILLYAFTFKNLNTAKFVDDQISEWFQQILEFSEKKSTLDASETQLCYVLQFRGRLEIILPILSGTGAEMNLEKGYEHWLELAERVDRCPTFPISSFADLLTNSMDFIAEHPKFDELCGKIDLVLAKRAGAAEAADRCRDRAISFMKSGKILRALDQIHKAKIGWFNEEAMEGAAIACHTLSNIYSELGLEYAAKHYALLDASLSINAADDSFRDRVPQALSQAALCDLTQGQWLSFWKLTHVMCGAHSQFSPSPHALNKHNFFVNHLHAAFRSMIATERFFPDQIPVQEEQFLSLSLGKEFDEVKKETGEAAADITGEQIAELMQESLIDRPWSDLGKIARARWKALDIEWEFNWENTWELTHATEEVMALIQMSLTRLTQIDTCFLPGKIFVTTKLSEAPAIKLRHSSSNTKSSWILEIPKNISDDPHYWQSFYPLLVGNIANLLHQTSVLPEEKLKVMIDDQWIPGVMENGFFGESFRRAFKFWLPKELFAEEERAAFEIEGSTWKQGEIFMSKHLTSKCELASNVSDDELLSLIQRRYEFSQTSIALTLERLQSDGNFKETHANLSSKGWKDWHFLIAISGIAMNHRLDMNALHKLGRDEAQKRMITFRDMAESEKSVPIPKDKLTQENLIFSLNGIMMSTLQGHGFIIRVETPNFAAVSDFLGRYLGYWDMDVEHDPVFNFVNE